MIQKRKRKILLRHKELNYSFLEPKTSVLPVRRKIFKQAFIFISKIFELYLQVCAILNLVLKVLFTFVSSVKIFLYNFLGGKNLTANVFRHELFPWGELTKTIVFGFLIASIASFYGYFVKGGSINVGKASTQAVVISSICILIANFILTQMILL